MKPNSYLTAVELMYTLLPQMKKYFHNVSSGDQGDIPRHLYPLLLISHYCGKKNMTTIADYLGMSKPLVTQQVEKLIEYGLMNRSFSSEDRRIIEISLTAKGLKTAEKIKNLNKEKGAAALSPLSEDEIVVLQKSLSAVIDILKKINRKQY
jgi:DNA-binding MarR family transcriptional regulator